jgi:tripeptidyl-peptidase-1
MAPLTRLLFLSLSLAVANAVPSTSGRTEYAPRVIPAVWTKVGSAPANKPLTFDFIFSPRDAVGLEARMLEIAHSQSAWLSEEEVANYIAPSADVKASVEAAITELGANSMKYSRNGDTLTVTTTVGKAAKVYPDF